MDPNFLLPFIKSTKNIFETMLQLPVEMGEPAVKQSGSSSHDCSGLISFSGDMDGSVKIGRAHV